MTVWHGEPALVQHLAGVMNKATLQQAEPGKPRAEVSQGKKIHVYISQTKKMLIECVQGEQPVGCPNRGFNFCVHQPSAVPAGGDGLVFFCGGSVVVM